MIMISGCLYYVNEDTCVYHKNNNMLVKACILLETYLMVKDLSAWMLRGSS